MKQPSNHLITNVKKVYSSLDLFSVDKLNDLYRDDILFIDPVNKISGREELLSHFRQIYKDVLACQFEFDDNQQIIEESRASLPWTMIYQHAKLNGRKPIIVYGTSFLKFDDNGIYFHRDWFDMGAMVYEHVPLFGKLVRVIKSRLSFESQA